MIDVNKIMQTDALDIIFDGRNKEYGAYELRTNYRKRLTIAVGSMLALCGCVILLNSFTGKGAKKPVMYVVKDTQLDNFKEKQIEPPPLEPPRPRPQPIQTVQYTAPKITHEDVKPEEMPPPVDDMKDVKIGTANVNGDKDIGIVAPPISGDETGVIQAPPKKEEKEPEIYLTVQIESEYPGGLSAWLRYLNRTLPKYYTDDLVEQEIQGKVLVQFVVDTEGNVSDVRGIDGPKELMAIAEKVIRMSGKWTAAIQNGHKVKSYKRQPITFSVQQE